MLPTALLPLLEMLATLAVFTYKVLVSIMTTLAVPATLKLMLPLGVPMLPSVVPLLNLVTLTPKLNPVSCDPLPIKNVPATLAAVVMLPVADISPPVRKLPP